MRSDRCPTRRRSWAKAKPCVEPLEGRALLSVQIVGKHSVADTVGSITLTLQRPRVPGSVPTAELVGVDTVSGTALPGVDFAPVHQVITFAPNDRSKAVTIPIFPDDQNAGTRVFALTLNHAPVTADASNTRSAVITITHKAPALSPPRVTKTHELTSGDQVTGFVITFNKDLNPGQAEDLKNYGLHKSQAGSPLIPLRWAVYDTAKHAVTLIPASPVAAGRYVVENPGPDLHSHLVDLAGNALDGVGDGTSNGVFYASFSPRGVTPSPALKAALVANRGIHSARQSNRKERLAQSLGMSSLLLL